MGNALAGKKILVVGGTSLLGREVVKELTYSGGVVISTSQRFDRSSLAQVTPCLYTIGLDLTHDEGVHVPVAVIRDAFGILDGVVCLAQAPIRRGQYEALEPQLFLDEINGSLIGTYRVLKRVLPLMPERGRTDYSVVLFSSVYARIAPDFDMYQCGAEVSSLSYHTAKAGISQMARYFASALAWRGVRVNAVSPGHFPKPSAANSPRSQEASRRNPMRRSGRPAEIAGAVSFLLSEGATYITGQDIAVDGGWTSI